MPRSRVKSVEPLISDQEGNPFWHEVVLEGEPKPFALHSNWMLAHGRLKEGELVEYEPSEVPPYPHVRTHRTFKRLKKVAL